MTHIPRLTAHHILNLPTHGHASFITDPVQLRRIHCHNYYEIFIVAQGDGIHWVNSTSARITTGALYFMRPDDVHYYTSLSSNFKIINIVVPVDTITDLFHYMGVNFGSGFLEAVLPPHILFSMKEFKSIVTELEQLVLTKKIMKEKSDIFFRITLFNLLTKFLTSIPQKSTGNTPEWLHWLSLEMLKKENFTEGLSAMYRLSGKSVEHLSRTCRKYLGKSPSQLINDIRLEYAVTKLLSSHEKVIHICEDAGFDSLSHFYHIFKDVYGTSPSQFRKEMQAQGHNNLFDDYLYTAEIPDALPFNLLENQREHH